MRRVLRRARDGVALNVDEAAVALTARGADLADLCASAARVRDAGLLSAGRRGPNGRLPVTYSRKVFIPVTHLCRDTCHYCTFVTVPGKLRAEGDEAYGNRVFLRHYCLPLAGPDRLRGTAAFRADARAACREDHVHLRVNRPPELGDVEQAGRPACALYHVDWRRDPA